MSDVKAPAKPAPTYEGDYFAWSRDQAARLVDLRPKGIDWQNLAEEIESLGRSEKRAIRSDLIVVVTHLLKWQFQPRERKAGWRSSIAEHRKRIDEALRASPSLKRYPGTILQEIYPYALSIAAEETNLPETAFPEAYPFTIAQILDPDFYPEAARA
jgi:hypothetical protein